jgi:hypothetical protein
MVADDLSMDLSSEDSFRLNVLLASKPQAIRIDESAMAVHGLAAQGEAKVSLNPNCRDELYLRRVRELLSGHVTGSPGGYPVFLKRWTRMGQMRQESLEQLLLLGEPEAVVAAVCSPGLSDELARRAWWCMQDAENARRMLGSPAVVAGRMGPELASFLVEFLPFETETEKMTESVRLVLQPGLLSEAEQQDLWRRSARRQAYQVGFLLAVPHALPVDSAAHPEQGVIRETYAVLADSGNPVAEAMIRSHGTAGQAFFTVLQSVLKKPPTQDVVSAALDAVRLYFASLHPGGDPDLNLEQLRSRADDALGGAGEDPWLQCLQRDPARRAALHSLYCLSGLGYGVVRPVFRNTTAIGSLMRRKLEPVLKSVDELITPLR